MAFNVESTLLEAIVLSVIATESIEGSYGYKITQDVRFVVDISESTLYPVLRRLQKDGSLDTYNKEFSGRNRKYYKITAHGMIQLDNYRRDWIMHKKKIDAILFGTIEEKSV